MDIDTVGQASIARAVGGRHGIDQDRAAIGEDQPVPDDQRAFLPLGDAVVIAPQQSRALRDQEMPSSGSVVGILRDLGDDEARQIGIETRHETRDDHASGHKRIGRGRSGEIEGVARVAVGPGGHKFDLGALQVRIVCAADRCGEQGCGVRGDRELRCRRGIEQTLEAPGSGRELEQDGGFAAPSARTCMAIIPQPTGTERYTHLIDRPKGPPVKDVQIKSSAGMVCASNREG